MFAPCSRVMSFILRRWNGSCLFRNENKKHRFEELFSHVLCWRLLTTNKNSTVYLREMGHFFYFKYLSSVNLISMLHLSYFFFIFKTINIVLSFCSWNDYTIFVIRGQEFVAIVLFIASSLIRIRLKEAPHLIFRCFENGETKKKKLKKNLN